MTSLATIAHILPLALGIVAGSEVRQPMGIAIIGGFTTSTLLTLVVVPVILTSKIGLSIHCAMALVRNHRAHNTPCPLNFGFAILDFRLFNPKFKI